LSDARTPGALPSPYADGETVIAFLTRIVSVVGFVDIIGFTDFWQRIEPK